MHLFYFILFASFLFSTEVTFIVDMTLNPASNDGVYIVDTTEESTSVFMGPEGIQMTEEEDNFWEITLDLLPGTYNYKFRNGFCDNWNNCGPMFEDSLSECGVGEWNDRELVVGNDDITEGPYCFNTCDVGPCGDPPDTFPITFKVDMTIIGANSTGVFTTVKDGPLGIEMFDEDGDNIYEVTIDLAPGDYQFKFRNGYCDTWDLCPQEFWELDLGNQGCGVGEWNDRSVTVENQGFIYGPYCFDFCEGGECQPNVPIDVTFQVELTDEQMDMAAGCGVVVYGNFNNFDNWVNPYEMEYAGDNIYTLDETFISNDQLLYRYSICSGINAIPETDEGVGGCGIDMGGDCSSGTNWREQMVPYVSGAFDLDYFDSCPGFARVIMSVDMTNESISGNGVCIAGGTMPNGPQGTQMCDDDDDGIYSATLSFPYSSHQTYKFINGCGDTWENPGFEELPSSCTEGEWNDRYFDVFEDYQLEGPHTFGECSEGGGDDGGGTDGYSVNFSIDLNGTGYPNNDYDQCGINGSWNTVGYSWSGWGLTLSDLDGDGVFTGSLDSLEDELDVEYIVFCSGQADAWSGWGVTLGPPVGSECDFNPSDEYGNYGFTVNGSNLDISYCAGTCNSDCSDCIMGDVNSDGNIDILDVVAMVNYILNPDIDIDCADINGDLNVDILDIVAVVNIILN